MKKSVLIFGSLFAVLVIGIGVFEMIYGKDKDTEKPTDDTSKLTNQFDVIKLYDYILGFGEDVHNQNVVTVNNIGKEAILKNAVNQLVICGGQYDYDSLSYDVVNNKAKEIAGQEVNIDGVGVAMQDGEGGSDIHCSSKSEKCFVAGGSYCSVRPLNNYYNMINYTAENNNLMIIDQDKNLNKYKHTFTKGDNGNYYWVSSEPLTK